MQRYKNHGIAFQYPEDWMLEEENNEGDTTITVTDGETSFWSLHLMRERPQVEEVIEEIETAFKGEYDEVDVERSIKQLARREAEAREISFVCLELVNTAFVRVFRTGRFTVMILCQATDHELEDARSNFEAIADSLDVDLDGDILIS
ncbi:MAG: hypothetical protein H6824_19300 [Planctomycetaceae bacterium]|nr:hypothetical protein [Planctomycetaceae bacterium]